MVIVDSNFGYGLIAYEINVHMCFAYWETAVSAHTHAVKSEHAPRELKLDRQLRS